MNKEQLHPFDLAELMSEMTPEQQLEEFLQLDSDRQIDVFEYFSSFEQAQLLEKLDDETLNTIFSQLDNDDIDHLIQDNTELQERLDRNNKRLALSVMNYPADSAGRLMLTETLTIQKENKVKEVINQIKTDEDINYTSTVFVTENNKLIGYIQLMDLLTKPDEMAIGDFYHEIKHYVTSDTDQEEVMHIFSDYDLVVLAVVDAELNYLGYITVDYIVDVLQDEADEDMSIMGGVAPLDDSYLETSILDHVKKRIIWLMILMVTATITGTILAKYEHAFETLPVLVTFIPMLMDTGGNAGSQASTLIIRGIATKEITLSDIGKVIFKEFRIALVISIILAFVNFIRLMLIGQEMMIALVVSLTLVFTVIIAKFVGSILPLLADKLGFDPAVMSSPFITTIVDTCSILVYFSIASMLLKL